MIIIIRLQIALVDLLFSFGINPDGLIGHSAGELGCAYADGALTAEETILASYYRGRALLEADVPSGSMAAVGNFIVSLLMLFSFFFFKFYLPLSKLYFEASYSSSVT